MLGAHSGRLLGSKGELSCRAAGLHQPPQVRVVPRIETNRRSRCSRRHAPVSSFQIRTCDGRCFKLQRKVGPFHARYFPRLFEGGASPPHRRYREDLAIFNAETEYMEPFSSCFVGVEGVDGAGDVGGAVGAAAQLTQDAPLLQLREGAFSRGA